MITLSRTQVAVLAVPLLALLGLAGARLAGTGAATGPTKAQPLALVEPQAAVAPRIVVHVVGAVRQPGLFRVREGARVADAIARAGGPRAKADLAAVNLAAPLADGQQVLVPARLPPGSAPGTPAPGAKVSLSTATVEQLEELPGVGPVTAQKIVDWRTSNGPIRSVDDLDAVPGIGPARIEQLRDLVSP